jgi:enoyl-CoA hydratase
MIFQNLLVTIDQGICTITINRPDKLNALSVATLVELQSAFQQAVAEPTVRGIILTGSGPKAFIAGADIAEFTGLDAQSGSAFAQRGQAIFKMIEDSPKPVIAAVNGFALGGGCELAMACHIRVASENAKFGQPEVNLGLIPGYAGTQRLTQLVGKGKAMELLMTADVLDAQEAYRLGLANYVVSADQLLLKCNEILLKIFTKAPVAITEVIRCVDAYYTDGVNGFQFEKDAFGRCCATVDFQEGVTAFLEKRKAVFSGN